MRILPLIISSAVTVGLVVILNSTLVTPAPLGKLLSPQHGIWQNAEATDADFNADLHFNNLHGKSSVYFDDKLVPHVFADNDEDLYFIQGYLHAKFRLFQMDLQTKAAEGRASEIAGPKAISFDREQRRLGIRYAAEKALAEMEKDPVQKKIFDAYTNGVNAYIGSLTESETPIEYKILNILPEKWTNIRTALLLKMMAKMLSSGTEYDLTNTNAKNIFTPDELKTIYPQVPDSLVPMIPKGTVFDKPAIIPIKPANADSLYFNDQKLIADNEAFKPDVNNGSNNWAVAGSKTKSGYPILCNDPHLDLSLPSIWYQMQMSSPTSNSYGATLPGSPFIIIGFNDSCSWGVTNAQRDVKDFYEIKFKDKSKKEYWFNGKWESTTLRIEKINVKDSLTYYDTVAYTVFGPVMYDDTYNGLSKSGSAENISGNRNLALRWTAHDPSNEASTFYYLNRAKNYDDYLNAIKTFQSPGQNFIFATKTGDIALWQQAAFPARWNGQGLYIMPGEDSSFMWQGYIPQNENPHSLNPAQGYLESANQRPVDSTYPYFIPGAYLTPRSRSIAHFLDSMTGITPNDMMQLQNNYFNITASNVVPLLLKYVNENNLTANESKYLNIIKQWDLMANADSKGQSVYVRWWADLQHDIWNDELSKAQMPATIPTSETTMELLKRDSASKFIDDISTPQVETINDIVTRSLKNAAIELANVEKTVGLEWKKVNQPSVFHLLKNNLLPFARTNLNIGGDGDIINATYGSHGPSWRMVVSLTPQTEAYGVYPGGQSGNPGSKFYDNFIDYWVEGKYYPLWMMAKGEEKDKRVIATMQFNKS